jgi:hypothetical protein
VADNGAVGRDGATKFWEQTVRSRDKIFRNETVQKMGVVRPLSETDGGPNAPRRHNPG